MENPTTTTAHDITVKPIKKACTQCRQQKAKCDAHLHPDQPCSRCRKNSLSCVVSDSFKRLHKRERLSELEQEAEVLKKRLRSSEPVESHSSTSVINHSPHNVPRLVTVSPRPTLNPPSPKENTLQLSTTEVDTNAASTQDYPTCARSLNGILVTAQEVDDLFQIFFQHYAQHVPVLDPTISPNVYYSRSVFLFWSIISVAARCYPATPTLFQSISQSVNDLALLSVNSTSHTVHTIEGLLLILLWPSARDLARLEPTFPFAGLLVHLARQIGLHNPRATHEFYYSKHRRLRLSEAECAARSELWAICVIVYQRTCLSKGFVPDRMVETMAGSEIGKLNDTLRLQWRCLDLITRCNTAVVENGLRDMTSDQKRALDIILAGFEDQLRTIEADAKPCTSSSSSTSAFVLTPLATFDICMSRLHIQVFYLFKDSTIAFDGPYAKLLATSCTVLDLIDQLCSSGEFPPSPPRYVLYTLITAASSLLRIIKMSSLRNLDIERATTHLALAISLSRKKSIHSSDVFAKAASLLTRLWNDPKSLRKPDGSEDVTIKVLNRLAAGSVLDILWRAHDLEDEQNKQSNPSAWTAGSIASTNGSGGGGGGAAAASLLNGVSPQLQTASTAEEQNQFNFFDDPGFNAFDWALGDDFFSL